jgi:hypothetical protein
VFKPPCGDLAYQLRQLRDIRRDPPRVVAGEASIQCYCGMISSIKL